MNITGLKTFFVSLLLWFLTIILPFWVLGPLLLLHLNMQFAGPVIELSLIKIVGGVGVGMGMSLAIWIQYQFAYQGDGTAAPYKPPQVFLHKGIFAHSRNPMYLSYFMVFISLFFFTGVLLLGGYAIGAIWAFREYVIRVEEPKLLERYGKQYEKYMEQVPRWI